jgi:hypothetical protein
MTVELTNLSRCRLCKRAGDEMCELLIRNIDRAVSESVRAALLANRKLPDMDIGEACRSFDPKHRKRA